MRHFFRRWGLETLATVSRSVFARGVPLQSRRSVGLYDGSIVCLGGGSLLLAGAVCGNLGDWNVATLRCEADFVGATAATAGRINCPSAEDSLADARLRAWLQERGGFLMPSLGIQGIHGAGRGLVYRGASRIKSGTVLLSVPWSAILTIETAEQDVNVRKHRLLTGRDSVSFAVRLWLALHATEPLCFWEPWLSELPSGLNAGALALPVALSEQDLKELRGTALVGDAGRLRKQLFDEWQVLDQTLCGKVDWSRWLWAHAIVSTRSSTLDLDNGQGSVQCIMPIIDFANHSSVPNARVAGSRTGAQLIAVQDIEMGAEVQISYGDHSANQFLFAFGFIPHGAPLDYLVAPLPPAQTKEIAEVRNNLFGEGQPPRLQVGPGGFRDLLLALSPTIYAKPSVATLQQLLRFLHAWEAEIRGSSSSQWWNSLGISSALKALWLQRADPPPVELQELRKRHAAIVAAAIAEVEAELKVSEKTSQVVSGTRF